MVENQLKRRSEIKPKETAGLAVRVGEKVHRRPAGRSLPGGRSRPNDRGFFPLL